MTEYRLTVRFMIDPRADRIALPDEHTDWAPDRVAAQALGEKLLKDGVWVTAADGECFLVPPARIREVRIKQRQAPGEFAEAEQLARVGG